MVPVDKAKDISTPKFYIYSAKTLPLGPPSGALERSG